MTELHEYTALELHQLLQRREVSPVELTRHYLDRIERLDGEIGAFATVTPDAAIARARHVEEHVPTAAPLWGLPLADKDLHRRAGVPARFGSRAFTDFVPDESDELVLAVDAAGAVSLGKSATPEFGLPSYTEGLAGPPDAEPVGPGARRGRLERGSGGGRGIRDAAVRARLRRRRLRPHPRGGVRPRRGEAVARPGAGGLRAREPRGARRGRDRSPANVADAALLLDGMIAPTGYPPAHRYAVRAPGDDGPYLGAAIRGEGRFQLGRDDGFAVGRRLRDRRRARRRAPRSTARSPCSTDSATASRRWRPTPEPGYPAAFRTIWQAGAATIPVDGEAEALLEPLTRWLLERGRAVPARQLAEALAWLAGFEERVIRRFAPFDAVLTPALALTPPPVGWYDAAATASGTSRSRCSSRRSPRS